MRTELFDYHLPRELIATAPAEKREQSRLLVLHRSTGNIEHKRFFEITEHLRNGDLLVVNDSRVIRARIHGKRSATGGAVEFLLLERVRADGDQKHDRWLVLCRPAKKLKPGEEVYFANKRLLARVLHYRGEGEREVEFNSPDVLQWLDKIGEVPLPPYIVQRRREAREAGERLSFSEAVDAERYQTVYAAEPGSVAAPTAGLHFSNELLDTLAAQGVQLTRITLHVGPGTFKPVETENILDHPMHEERFEISHAAADIINCAHSERRRVVAVGTTAVRALESAADSEGILMPGAYQTKLMIYPGYVFKLVDVLITNFHLPRSTLLMLVSAFANRELVMKAYEEAVAKEYRFFSYGDAMLIT